jgi:hypothetical protein
MGSATTKCQYLIFSNPKAFENCVYQVNYPYQKQFAIATAQQAKKNIETPTARRLVEAQLRAAYPAPRIASNPYKPTNNQQISSQNAEEVLHQRTLEHIRATNQRVLQENGNSPFLQQFNIEKLYTDSYKQQQKINEEQKQKLQEYAKVNHFSHYQSPVRELVAATKLYASNNSELLLPIQLDRSDASNPYTKYVKGYTPFRSDYRKGLERLRTNVRKPTLVNGNQPVTAGPLLARLSEDIYNSTFFIDQEARNGQLDTYKRVIGAQQYHQLLDDYSQASQQFHREKPEYRKSASNPYHKNRG